MGEFIRRDTQQLMRNPDQKKASKQNICSSGRPQKCYQEDPVNLGVALAFFFLTTLGQEDIFSSLKLSSRQNPVHRVHDSDRTLTHVKRAFINTR